jgi:hypothetical protein
MVGLFGVDILVVGVFGFGLFAFDVVFRQVHVLVQRLEGVLVAQVDEAF